MGTVKALVGPGQPGPAEGCERPDGSVLRLLCNARRSLILAFMKIRTLFAFALLATLQLNAQAPQPKPAPSGSGSNPSNAPVKGYEKKDGTYIEPYHRTTPDTTQGNNYGTKGNVNPYTGKEGTKTEKK
jgi:hypothetical protein